MTLRRIAPLSGIVFVVLTAVAFVPLAGNTPGISDSSTKIADFYTKHHSKEETAAHILVIAVAFLALFAASCWPLFRDAGHLWTALFFGGGIIAVAGFLFAASTHLALADGAHHGLDAASLQALNALDTDNYPAFSAGLGIMMLGAAGATIPLGGALRVLGWIGLVLGISVFTPLGFVGFLGGGIWVIVFSVLMFMRAGDDAQRATAAG